MNLNFNTSNYYYQAFRFLFPLLGVVLILTFAILIYFQVELNINGSLQKSSIENISELLYLAIIFLAISLPIRNKIAYVEFRVNISKLTSGSTKEFETKDIESIKQIQFVFPPMYSMKLKDDNKKYLFIIHKEYLQFGAYVKDISSDGERIKELLRNINK